MTDATTTILAIDLGKYKSVACVYQPAGGEVHFATLRSNSLEIAQLIDRQRPSVVVIEACALSGWVHDICGELGLYDRC